MGSLSHTVGLGNVRAEVLGIRIKEGDGRILLVVLASTVRDVCPCAESFIRYHLVLLGTKGRRGITVQLLKGLHPKPEILSSALNPKPSTISRKLSTAEGSTKY